MQRYKQPVSIPESFGRDVQGISGVGRAVVRRCGGGYAVAGIAGLWKDHVCRPHTASSYSSYHVPW